MARRKSALIFMLLFLTILILSPWAAAPSPIAPPAPVPDRRPSAEAVPAAPADPIQLRVAVALDDAEFRFLQKQNDDLAYRYRDIAVQLTRVDPDKAYDEFTKASQIGEAPDVMLLPNEWVIQFAASGYLLPADSAFVREALAEQFDALSASVKWNGYLWGVPRDFDPYVLVWNLSVLHTLLGDTAISPQGPAQWAVLAEKSRGSRNAVSWLAINGQDGYALLAWLQTVTAQRTDTLWNGGGSIWNGTPRGDAMALLDREKQKVTFTNMSSVTADLVVAGKTAAAVIPYSEAVKRILQNQHQTAGNLEIDRSAWKLPYHWPRGRSFTVSSQTQAEDAARRWIAVMTEDQVQQANELAFGKLPVYRSMYGGGSSRASLISVNAAGVFPNMAPAELGPELPIRLRRLGQLWKEWTAGRLTVDDWVRRWPETSADLELNH
ncbi:MAG: extracellular solute-binding protein [Cohnella sp.]|nr:extracellular solute-binding protein [Cohnella sp.]